MTRNKMNYTIFAYSKKGCETANRIMALLDAQLLSAWCPARILEMEAGEGEAPQLEKYSPIPKLFRPFYGERFGESDAMIFVGACGIAVREIAPFVKSKKTDPAVLCVDDHARFVIPVLSGHIGGANELAAKLAALLDATPVITTATDINNRFSVDTWASKNGYVIDNLKTAKHVSAAILDRDVALCSALPIAGKLPNGVFLWEEPPAPKIGIYIGWEKKKPFAETLRLVPKVLTIGIGCRKGTDKEAIRTLVTKVLQEHDIDIRSIGQAASIDIKAEEAGLLEFCREAGWEIRFYSAEELKAVPGEFSSSGFVKSVTGVDNVCERAAMADADLLIVPKTAEGGVTVAVALKNSEISF